jgi:hypothetical protein
MIINQYMCESIKNTIIPYKKVYSSINIIMIIQKNWIKHYSTLINIRHLYNHLSLPLKSILHVLISLALVCVPHVLIMEEASSTD